MSQMSECEMNEMKRGTYRQNDRIERDMMLEDTADEGPLSKLRVVWSSF